MKSVRTELTHRIPSWGQSPACWWCREKHLSHSYTGLSARIIRAAPALQELQFQRRDLEHLVQDGFLSLLGHCLGSRDPGADLGASLGLGTQMWSTVHKRYLRSLMALILAPKHTCIWELRLLGWGLLFLLLQSMWRLEGEVGRQYAAQVCRFRFLSGNQNGDLGL